LAEKTTARLSIDTRNARVMGEAVAAGAHIVNDVSALTHDPLGLAMAAEMGVPVFLMHAQGDPQTMQENPRYDDVVTEVRDWLSGRIAACVEAGIAREQIAIDPGIGFGKTIEHNLVLLKHVDAFTRLGAPILVGASRKGFIGRLSGVDTAADRISGSLAAALAAVAGGADFIRVHDVEETRQALSVWTAIDTIDLWRDA
ncbi:MAG: dihydropteroate synthase, partial [Planctomycetota bacterium]